MPRDDIGVHAERQTERQKRQRDDSRRKAVNILRVFAVADDTMISAGPHQQGCGQKHQTQSGQLQILRGGWHLLETRLEGGAQLKPDQDLRAEDKHTPLVQCCLDFVLELRHDPPFLASKLIVPEPEEFVAYELNVNRIADNSFFCRMSLTRAESGTRYACISLT